MKKQIITAILLVSIVLFCSLTVGAENLKVNTISMGTESINSDVNVESIKKELKTAKKIEFRKKFMEADHCYIRYVGRMDFTNPKRVKFSGAGAYLEVGFKGTYIEMVMSDASGLHNYITVVIDDKEPVRIQLLPGEQTYKLASDLSSGDHTLLVCKETEASMGYVEFLGFRCKRLLPLKKFPERKIECFGNSITVGSCMLVGEPCEQVANNTNWNAANSAYNSYGALTARSLNADWVITAWSGIGMIRSCCNMEVTLPKVFDRVYLDQPEPMWDFNKYIPEVVTVCLGQNDGVANVLSQDYKETYISFIDSLRSKYPYAAIFCLTSPMADDELLNAMKSSLQEVINHFSSKGDTKIFPVELPYGLRAGCEANPHPNKEQHKQIAEVLTKVIKDKMGW